MDSRDLVSKLRDPDYAGELQHLRSWSEIDRLFEAAASHIEAQDKLIANMASDLKDMASIIERAHDSGDMVDGGDLRYWVQLLRFAKVKALSQKDTP